MRAIALVLLVGCGHHYHPAVMPNLSEVPADRRDDIIQSSLSRPTREQQPASEHGREVETFASTFAAYLGMMFSRDDNASMGAQWIDVDPPKRRTPVREMDTPADGSVLVPWVRLDAP